MSSDESCCCLKKYLVPIFWLCPAHLVSLLTFCILQLALVLLNLVYRPDNVVKSQHHDPIHLRVLLSHLVLVFDSHPSGPWLTVLFWQLQGNCCSIKTKCLTLLKKLNGGEADMPRPRNLPDMFVPFQTIGRACNTLSLL